MALARWLNRFGLSALRLSLPYHDLRMPEELVRADYMLSPNLGRTLQSLRQAVIDSRAALDWLVSQGYTRLAILGTSIGSCVAMITTAHDHRVSVSVQNHISPYFADVVWTGISTRHVRAGIEGHISLEDLREIWLPISPKAYVHKLAGTGKKSLLIYGIYDHSFLPQYSREMVSEYQRAWPAALHPDSPMRALHIRGISVQPRPGFCDVRLHSQEPLTGSGGALSP